MQTVFFFKVSKSRFRQTTLSKALICTFIPGRRQTICAGAKRLRKWGKLCATPPEISPTHSSKGKQLVFRLSRPQIVLSRPLVPRNFSNFITRFSGCAISGRNNCRQACTLTLHQNCRQGCALAQLEIVNENGGPFARRD